MMGTFIRAMILYLTGTTVGTGWSTVLAYRDMRNKPNPAEPLRPAPTWVNVCFMLGLTGILVGLSIFQWKHLEWALTPSVLTTFIGMVFLNIGAWGLLFTTARKGSNGRKK